MFFSRLDIICKIYTLLENLRYANFSESCCNGFSKGRGVALKLTRGIALNASILTGRVSLFIYIPHSQTDVHASNDFTDEMGVQ